MSVTSGEQPKYGYGADLPLDSDLTAKEIMRRAQQGPFAFPRGWRDAYGSVDADGWYWYDQPLPNRPARIAFGDGGESERPLATPPVLTNITVESTPRPEDVAARYQYLKEGVTPDDVVDWVRSAQRGTNIVLGDKIAVAGYEPDEPIN